MMRKEKVIVKIFNNKETKIEEKNRKSKVEKKKEKRKNQINEEKIRTMKQGE